MIGDFNNYFICLTSLAVSGWFRISFGQDEVQSSNTSILIQGERRLNHWWMISVYDGYGFSFQVGAGLKGYFRITKTLEVPPLHI